MNELAPDARFVPGMLSVRACNVIDNTLPYVNAPHGEVHLNLNAATLADLARMSVLDLRRAKGCGPKIRAEIRRLLQRAGLDLQHVGTPMGATLSVTVSEVNNKYDSAGRLISASGQAHTSSETAIQYDGLQILSANTAKENEILYSLSPLKAIVEYWAYLNRPGGTTVDWSKVTAEQRSYMENLVSTISGLLTSAVPLQSAMAGLVQKTQTTGRGASGASTSQTGSTNLDLTDFLPIFSTLNNLNEKLLAEVEAVLASVSGPQPSGISGALSSILQGINRMLDLKTKLAGTIAGGGLKGVPKQYTESTTQNTYAIVAGQAVLMNASTNSDTFTGFGAHDPHPVTTTHTTRTRRQRP
jgi:hypothetical protein